MLFRFNALFKFMIYKELKIRKSIFLLLPLMIASVQAGAVSDSLHTGNTTKDRHKQASGQPDYKGVNDSTEGWKIRIPGELFLSEQDRYIDLSSNKRGVSIHKEKQQTKKQEKTEDDDDNRFKGLNVSGHSRMYFFSRHLQESFDFPTEGGITRPFNVSIGDGYTQPFLRMYISGSPFPATKFELELSLHNDLLRTYSNNALADGQGRLASPWQRFNFQAETYTDYGKFKVIAGGGVNWYKMTPLTLWSNNIDNRRDDMFIRFPWAPNYNEFQKYNDYYNEGDIPRDERWGNAATQGVILEGSGLPWGLNASLLFGKTSASAGYESYLNERPMNSIGISASKNIGAHQFGFNYMDHFGNADNNIDLVPTITQNDTFYVEENRLSQMVATGNARLNFDFAEIYLEAGASSYLSSRYNDGLKDNAKPGLENASRYKRNFSEVIFSEIKLNNMPLNFGFFRLSPEFVNVTSAVMNTSVDQSTSTVSQTTGGNNNTIARDGLIVMPGQMTSNRQALNAGGNHSFGPLNVVFKYQIGQEVKNLYGDLRTASRASNMGVSDGDSANMLPYTNSITIQHHLNRLGRSRFGFWQRFSGPYNRIENVFRQSYENFAITDTDVDYKKSFSSMRLELKYKTRLFNKDLILINDILYNSVQDKISPATFNDNAFIRYFFSQFFTAYAIHPKLTLIGTFSIERVRGNDRVELADEEGNIITNGEGKVIPHPDGNPVNQTGIEYGYGLDYNFHEDASLHLRHKWYDHKDENFIRDVYRGQEATLELKVFF